eukprot:2427684-Lingulodinium_polyedra.AAC.1
MVRQPYRSHGGTPLSGDGADGRAVVSTGTSSDNTEVDPVCRHGCVGPLWQEGSPGREISGLDSDTGWT